MKRSSILLAFVATGALVAGPAFAKQSRNETAPMHMKSSTLMEAQKKLNQEGFDAGRADGKWGTKTAEAVKSFQRRKIIFLRPENLTSKPLRISGLARHPAPAEASTRRKARSPVRAPA